MNRCANLPVVSRQYLHLAMNTCDVVCHVQLREGINYLAQGPCLPKDYAYQHAYEWRISHAQAVSVRSVHPAYRP